MCNSDIEATLGNLAEEWPGQSVATAVLDRLPEHPVVRSQKSKFTNVAWRITALAASVAFIGVGLVFFSPRTVQAAIRDGLKQAGKAHVLRELFGDDGVQKAEIWFHREKGIRAESLGQVIVDDGAESWTWSKNESGETTVMRRPSMDGVQMIMEMCGGEHNSMSLMDSPAPDYDDTVGNNPCHAYMMKIGTDGTQDLRVIVLMDDQGLPRRILHEKRIDEEWKKSLQTTIDYEAELRPHLFVLDYPKGANIYDVEEALEGRFPVSKALATDVKDGIQFAVHEAIPIDDGTYYIVSSVRGTRDYLKKYPPTKRRFNLQYTALDIVQQLHYHGSPAPKFHQLSMFQFEWQGVHYMWWLMAPKGQRELSEFEPTAGQLKLTLFANHLHPANTKSTSIEIDTDIATERVTLESVIAKARIDMNLASAVFGETKSLPIARSLANTTVQFTSFDETTDEAYANEMRKARGQMDVFGVRNVDEHEVDFSGKP